MPRLALVDDDAFLSHEAPSGHPERSARVTAARRGVAASRWAPGDAASEPRYHLLAPRDATEDELTSVHTRRYVEALSLIRGRSGYLDGDTFHSPRSVDVALRAAGGAIALVEETLADRADFGFGILRPPGHHACPGHAMGFCLLNNAALAARHALRLGAERVLVLDWDVHHGNGTQEAFYDDPAVLYVSLHEWPQYPGTGRREECGHAAGLGFTINVPLSKNAGDAVYAEAFRRLLVPAVERYAPGFVIVSAGYDAHERDPLGRMRLTASGFARMTNFLLEATPVRRGMIFLLEGGYDLLGIEQSVTATLDALLVPPGTVSVEPALEVSTGPHSTELDRAVRAQHEFWDV